MESMHNHPTLDWKHSHLRDSRPPSSFSALGSSGRTGVGIELAQPRQQPYKLLRILIRVYAYSRLGSVIQYVETMEDHVQ